MTYQNVDLCEKLKYRFKDRGLANVTVRPQAGPNRPYARPKTEVPRSYAGRFIDPSVTAENAERRPRADRRSVRENIARNYGTRGSGAENVPLPGEPYGTAYAIGNSVRYKAARFNDKAYERRRGVTEKKTKKKKASFLKTVGRGIASFFAPDDALEGITEKKIKRKPFPKGLVFGVVLCTVMLFVVIGTYSGYFEATREVASLKETQSALLEERDKLSNMLSVRDDIREIEKYAVDEIGMVKSDYIETRHVSIAGGERIEVIKNGEEDASEGTFSTMLSAMGGNFQKLLEYID